MKSIVISPELVNSLLEQAARSPEQEICGLLFGDAGCITHAEPTANVALDPRSHFEIDPARLIAAHRAERGGGARMIGHYHSHPRGDARPSARDLAAAEPGRLWLIIAGGGVRAWISGDGTFGEVNLILAPLAS